MHKILSSLLKYKKTIIFVFLVATIFLLPKTSLGQTTSIPNQVDDYGCGFNCVYNSTGGYFYSGICECVPLDSIPGIAVKCNAGCRANVINTLCLCQPIGGGEDPDGIGPDDEFWTSLYISIPRAILWGSWTIAKLASQIFSVVMDAWVKNVQITGDFAFSKGWANVRDLGNMLIALGFIVIGIATALRISEYEAKKLLPKLIIVALLVNFSGLFCGLIIDASNIATTSFTQGAGNSGTETVQAVALSGRTGPLENADAPNRFIRDAILYAAIYIAIAITYFYMAIIMIIRYALLVMLYILSPLAFVFWAFPPTKKLASEWWSNFLKWAFVGVIGGFFLNLAVNLLPHDAAGVSTAGTQSYWPALIIALLFMIVGFKITSKSSGLAGMATTAVMGAVTGGASLAMGAVAKGAKMGGGAVKELAGRTDTGRKVREGLSNAGARFAETTGLAPQGHANDVKSKLREQHGKVAKGMTDDQVNSELTRNGGRGAKGAAFAEEAISRKILSKGRKPDEVNTLIANAEPSASITLRKDATKLEPSLARFDQSAIKQHGSADAAEANAFAKSDVSAIKNFSEDTLKSKEFINNTPANKIERAMRDAAPSAVSAVQGHIPYLQEKAHNALIQAHVTLGGVGLAAGASAADKQKYYDDKLSGAALQGNYNSMSQGSQARWGNSLSQEEKKIYDTAGGMANAAEAYKDVMTHRLNQAADATLPAGQKINDITNKIVTIKDLNNTTNP